MTSTTATAENGIDPRAIAKQDPFLFLNLPVEVRMEVYGLLLISRFDSTTLVRGRPVHGRGQQPIAFEGNRGPLPRNITTGLLRVCRQVYREAVPVLYGNEFVVHSAGQVHGFFSAIGPEHVAQIRKVLLVVSPSTRETDRWVDALHAAAEHGHCLQHLSVDWQYTNPHRLATGLSSSVPFVRALVRIQGLRTLTIRGFYPKEWPAYLSKKMCVPVQQGWPANLVATDPLRPDVKMFIQYQKYAAHVNPWEDDEDPEQTDAAQTPVSNSQSPQLAPVV